jgi:hypothetical protein
MDVLFLVISKSAGMPKTDRFYVPRILSATDQIPPCVFAPVMEPEPILPAVRYTVIRSKEMTYFIILFLNYLHYVVC